MKPTEEQQLVVDANDRVLKIIAFAGTGKTSTLHCRANTQVKRTLYLCFNKSVQVEAEKRFPKHVTCKTQHGLAYQAIIARCGYKGIKYNSVGKLFLKPTAQRFRIDYYMVSLVHKTIENFCNSADPELTKAHAQPDAIGRYTYDVTETVVDYARQIWELMIGGQEQQSFPMTHGGYLKLFQMSKPRLGYAVIMLDEAQDCQPTGTTVLCDTGIKPIENVKAGDTVISYTMKSLRLRKSGSKVLAVTKQSFSGDLVVVRAGEKTSRYTPGHICIAKVGPAFQGKTLIYLMRRGNNWRVGITKANHGKNGGESGLAGRLREELADDIYVLEACESRRQARNKEMEIGAVWSIPEITFQSSNSSLCQSDLNSIWEKVGDNSSKAEACLRAHGRVKGYPLATRSFTELGRRSGYLLYTRAATVRACNLMDGMEVIVADSLMNGPNTRYNRSNLVRRFGNCWRPIKVARQPYDGTIYSLSVAKDKTYVGDGIVTHNCNPVVHDIVSSQSNYGAQVLLCGDPYQQIYQWLGAIDAMEKFNNGKTLYLTQSFRFGAGVAGIANHLLNAFFNEERKLIGLGAESRISGTRKHLYDQASEDETLPECYTFLARTNAFLFAEASRRAGTCKMFVPGSGANGELPIFQAVLDVFALYQGRKMDIKGDFDLRHFDDYWQFLDFVKTGMADPEWTISAAMIEKYKEGIPQQIENIRKSLVSRPEDAQVTLITAHRAKGMEWDNVVLGDDYAELFDDYGNLRQIGGDRKTQVAHDEVNLLYVAATRAKKHLTLNAQLSQLLAYREERAAGVKGAKTGAEAEAKAEAEALSAGL